MTPTSLLASLWRRLPVEGRRRWLYGLTSRLVPAAAWPPPPTDGSVIMGGEIARQSGLGEVARLMLDGLRAIDVPAAALDTGTIEHPFRRIDTGGVAASPRAALLLQVNAPQLPAALLRMPRRFIRGRRIVGCWTWELPTTPPIWRAGVRCVHQVWVQSAFTAAALEHLVPGRIRIVPPPLAAHPPQPSTLDRAAFGLPADAVVTLLAFSLSSSFERKNPLAGIAAFRRAFGDRPDRILVVKTVGAESYPDDMRRLRAATEGAANIRFESRAMPRGDIDALTRTVDIVLSPHRSEGLGLVPAEAMFLRRAVVATDWSATSEFLDPTCALPVPYRLIPAQDPRGVFEAPGAVWADIDVDAAARALRQAADDPVLRDRLGAQAEIAAHRHFSTAPLAAAIHALMTS